MFIVVIDDIVLGNIFEIYVFVPVIDHTLPRGIFKICMFAPVIVIGHIVNGLEDPKQHEATSISPRSSLAKVIL